MQDKESYVFKETLRDGTPITLRAARADDGPKIRRAFKNLNRDTIYTRFFGFKSDVSDAELERITGADFDHDVALLVTIGPGDDEVVVAGASYAVIETDPPPRSAEIAFTVEEDFQGLGIAGLLLRHLVRIARQKNLACLKADVLARNRPMLAVFRRSGLPITLKHDGDVIQVALSLAEAVV
jgi:RimJ/RimL family protein N-acetyltransferase